MPHLSSEVKRPGRALSLPDRCEADTAACGRDSRSQDRGLPPDPQVRPRHDPVHIAGPLWAVYLRAYQRRREWLRGRGHRG